MKIPRHTSCRHWYPNYPIKVSGWSPKECSLSAITNAFGDWVTWPDLVIWPALIFGWNFQEGYGKDALKGMQKTAALCAAVFSLCSKKTDAGRVNVPPPSGPTRVQVHSEGGPLNKCTHFLQICYLCGGTLRFLLEFRIGNCPLRLVLLWLLFRAPQNWNLFVQSQRKRCLVSCLRL